MSSLPKRVEELLSDPLCQQLSSETFNPEDFVSKQISGGSIESLIETITQFEKREKLLDGVFRVLTEENPDFIETQFQLPEKMSGIFDSLNNLAIQGKRKVAQCRSILDFNSDELSSLNEEVQVLRHINAELQHVESINELLLELSVFMKRGLHWESAQLCKKLEYAYQSQNPDAGRPLPKREVRDHKRWRLFPAPTQNQER